MDTQRLLEELLALLEAGDITIRREPLGGGGGGLCKLKGQFIFFLDTQAPPTESANLCAEAADKILDVENIYIKPEVRQFIEEHRSETKED